MSNSSDSEEFFDAEDNPNNRSRRGRSCGSSGAPPSKSETDLQQCLRREERQRESGVGTSSLGSVVDKQTGMSTLASSSSSEVADRGVGSRRRLKELRQRMQTEDEEVGGSGTHGCNSPTGSQSSSLDGVFMPDLESTRSTHPFRILETDALSLHSLTSLGRSQRLASASQDQHTGSLSGRESMISGGSGGGSQVMGGSTVSSGRGIASAASVDSQTSPKEQSKPLPPLDIPPSHQVVKLQEPDVVASTKAPPIAPPRRKKKMKTNKPPVKPPDSLPINTDPPPLPIALVKSVSSEMERSYSRDSTLPSPSFTIESLAREFENSLDITSAVRGEYVVRPGDLPPASSHTDSSAAGAPPRLGRVCSRNSSTYPLGSHVASSPSPLRERRRSAGDEKSLLRQHCGAEASSTNHHHHVVKHGAKMFVRTRTDSGKPLSDLEILEQVTVLNLDTGERIPLSIAEDKLPQCINPLSLHIMRLTSEYVSNTSLEKDKESDGESVGSIKSLQSLCRSTSGQSTGERRSLHIKRFLGQTVRRTVRAIGRQNKDEGQEVDNSSTSTSTGTGTGTNTSEGPPGEQYIKLKVSNSHKGPYEFDCLQHVQELSGEHQGPVWCMKFSSCGRLLATAGQDRVLRIWVVTTAYPYFKEMRAKYDSKVSPSPSQESLSAVAGGSCQAGVDDSCVEEGLDCDVQLGGTASSLGSYHNSAPRPLAFCPKPFCTYSGHTSDLLDISWSKNYFILSSSMDKTVRLWHISRKECLCCFQHIEFVTAIVFHPRDDRYFLSGSLDGKLRLWNIPDKKVAVWNEVDGQTKLITAANFCQNGKFAVIGTYDGRCIFYNTDQLTYYTQIHVRSSRGKNSTGRKISGIEPMPGEDKILVTSNDSRIRLYDLRDLNLSCKYKGYVNMSSQIRASFSHDGKYIVSGSENQCIYIWKSTHDYFKFSSVRRDRNDYWEGIKVHNATVTCAVFSPNPDMVIKHVLQDSDTTGYLLVSADFNGAIKVFINRTKPKHSSLPASAIV